MKKLALIFVIGSLFFGSTQSCLVEKEEVPVIFEPDSGYYDPTSYFPLKWGAKWVYETKAGGTLEVNCGPHDIDTVGGSYAYHYHRLYQDSYYLGSLTEKYWNGAYVGYKCVKGGIYSIGFMAGPSGSPGWSINSWSCGPSGPGPDEPYFCLDSAITIDGFSNVFSYTYGFWTSLNLVYDSAKSAQRGGNFFQMPIVALTGKTYIKTYYAQGIGVIRKEEINDQGQVVDFFRLTSYYFP